MLEDHGEQVGLKDSWKDTVAVVEDSLADHLLVDIPKVVARRHSEESGCHSLGMHVALEVLLLAVVDTVRVDRTFAVVMLEHLEVLVGSFPVEVHLAVLEVVPRSGMEILVEGLIQKWLVAFRRDDKTVEH